MINYPPFPTYKGDLATTIIQIILWIIEIPLIAIGNMIIAIAGGASTGAEQSITTVLEFPAQVFDSTVSSFSAYGVFAPVIASLIWGVSLIILVFLIFKAIQIAGDEITNEE